MSFGGGDPGGNTTTSVEPYAAAQPALGPTPSYSVSI